MDINIVQLLRILNFKEGELDDFFNKTLILEQEGNFKPTAALWDAEEAGDISIYENDKGKMIIKDLGNLNERSYDEELRRSIMRIVSRYYRDGRAVNKNQIESYLFTPDRLTSPKLHAYMCTLDWLVVNNKLVREELTVPGDKKTDRPKRNFILFAPYEAREEGLVDKFKAEWLANFKSK